MAFDTQGFAGTLNAKEWAEYQTVASHEPIVAGPADLTPTAAAGTRAVSIARGSALAHGVVATEPGSTLIPFATPIAPGQWHLVVLRRSWSAVGTSTAALISLIGGVTGAPAAGAPLAPVRYPDALPAGFETQPGAVADQAIVWVWVSSSAARAAGAPSIQIFDVRRTRAEPVPTAIEDLLLRRDEVEGRDVTVVPSSFTTLVEFSITTPKPIVIDVNGWARWWSAANAAAAGKIIITLNGRQCSAGPRDHNEGKDFGPRQITVTGRALTRAGANTLALVATTEPTSVPRIMRDYILEAWRH
jgi:hypothetical protein